MKNVTNQNIIHGYILVSKTMIKFFVHNRSKFMRTKSIGLIMMTKTLT